LRSLAALDRRFDLLRAALPAARLAAPALAPAEVRSAEVVPSAVALARVAATVVLATVAFALVAIPPRAAAETSSPGELYAFGDNRFGELASAPNNGAEAANPVPLFASLPGAEAPIVELAAGDGASLALTADGVLYSFGENRYGELGRALDSGSEPAEPLPTRVAIARSGERLVQVAAGGAHSLALSASGQLYAFGLNAAGQLGSTTDNGTENANPAPERVTLPGTSAPVSQIAAGGAHSLALTSTGQLYAFGSNRFGQLGSQANSGSEAANPSPLPVSLPGAVGPVTQIAAGSAHSLALTETGQLYAFGSNQFGQLGSQANSGSELANATPRPVSLPGASGPVTEIAAGAFHSLALTSTGQLYAFGRNSAGQLGTDTGIGTPNPTPALVALPADADRVVQIVAGASDSMLVTADGRLYAFGSNEAGQLGSTANAGTAAPNPAPAMPGLPLGTTVDTVARGATASHTLALVADLAVLDGTLPAGQVGVPYGAVAAASGSTGPYSWSASGLPAGLSIDPLSGRIAGTPVSAGTSNVVLHVSDPFGIGATSATIPLTIAPAPAPARAFISSTLTKAQIRASLNMQLGAKGREIKLAALRKRHRYVYAFTALTAGVLTIDWYYLLPGARLAQRARPVLFASGHASFPTAGTRTVTLTLTLSARKLLRHRKRIALSVRGSFTPSGKRTIVATRSFELPR
jgi:alpha-tubulin suppressor-like RCC1 family protein